ncbi:hypothetical protein GCM10028808_19810 [Spirosoma migulaei]
MAENTRWTSYPRQQKTCLTFFNSLLINEKAEQTVLVNTFTATNALASREGIDPVNRSLYVP